MNFERLETAMEIPRLQASQIAIIGAGGSADLICNLTRCGIQDWILFDYDRVAPSNITRQGHFSDQIGEPKVSAVEESIRRINPDANVVCFVDDFTSLDDAIVQTVLSHTDLFIFATDSFKCQARGNEVALLMNTPAVWVGLYPGGEGGEVAFWHSDLDCCWRCLCCNRYEAQGKAAAMGTSADPTSAGATIFDIQFLDAIAGQLVVGLLTRGSNNRFGRLIDELGDRQFVQAKIAPEFTVNGRDIVREQLGIVTDCDRYIAWNTIARRDPDHGQLFCPDCEKYRGHKFVEVSSEKGATTLRQHPDKSAPTTQTAPGEPPFRRLDPIST